MSVRSKTPLDSWEGPTTGGAPDEEHPVRAEPQDRSYLLVFDRQSSTMFQLPRSGEVVIGRSEKADLRLQDSSVSRKHAKILLGSGEPRILDLDSQNGTQVNGDPVTTPRALVSGDTITICSTTLVFHSGARSSGMRPSLDFAQLRQRAEEELERSLRYDRPLTVVAIALGVGTADRPRVSRALAGRLRLMDIVGWGGADQLFVLMPEVGADAVPTAVRPLLARLVEAAPAARAGFATCPGDGCDVDSLLASARAASLEAQPGTLVAAAQTSKTLEIGDRTVIVADPAMVRLYALLERLAPADLPVLIQGETGTGKELAAWALHFFSPRRGRPLLALNCAAMQENLVESELFGHERGAFSGAVAAKPGLFETAAGGTLLLDEIGELSAGVQAKLLRALETKRVTRLGDLREREVDIRVVASTNRDLDEEVRTGRFRKDLYFRLSGTTLWLPPLRDRKRELPILAQTFLASACERAGRPPMNISNAAMQRMALHSWPGNVRELKNMLDYVAATVREPTLEAWHLPERIAATAAAAANDVPTVEIEPLRLDPPASEDDDVGAAPPGFRPIEEELRELERARMAAALAATGGNQTRAAELIRMPLRTFVAKLKQYKLVRHQSPRKPRG